MDKQITKLNSDELLEVSGGRENYVKRSWAKKYDAVDLEMGENNKDDAEREDENSEISIDLKKLGDEEDD